MNQELIAKAKSEVEELGKRPGFSDTDLVVNDQIFGITTKYQGKEFELTFERSGNANMDERYLRSAVEAFREMGD